MDARMCICGKVLSSVIYTYPNESEFIGFWCKFCGYKETPIPYEKQENAYSWASSVVRNNKGE